MIFDFTLDSIEKVQPWGTPNSLSIHWFALTQGKYRLKVGDEYLLNYTDEFIGNYLKKKPQHNISTSTFTEYYVVRLWEDILGILPAILESVPVPLQKFLNSGYENYQVLQKLADGWKESETVIKRIEGIGTADLAVFWLNERWFDSGYLSPSANIWLWSDENNVIFNWDNSEIKVEEIPVWTATKGSYRINKQEFVNEVREFNKKLLDEMGKRVETICQNWKNDEIKIDFEQLKSEQKNRAMWLESTLKNLRRTDWSQVISAVNQIND